MRQYVHICQRVVIVELVGKGQHLPIVKCVASLLVVIGGSISI
jgi:hypothetical protein